MSTRYDNSYRSLLCQEALHFRGLYDGPLDNLFGPVTEHAYQEFMTTILRGKGTWAFFGQIEGDDIVVRNVWATAFGGNADPQDNGETASGYNTKDHPAVTAVALPMDGYGVKSLTGSPIPKLQFGLHSNGETNPDGAHVIVTSHDGKETPALPVIDLGPSRSTQNGIDLTVAAAKMFYPQASASNFKVRVDYRILGAAKHVQPT